MHATIGILTLNLLLAFTLFSHQAEAQIEGTYQVIIKKQEEKKRSRWSLADWLEQKQKNKMMDLWLAENSHSSPFEFFLEARNINYESKPGTSAPPATAQPARIDYGGTFAAYAGLAGLRGEYESTSENTQAWSGSFNLRILGRALQDTHLNLGYGAAGFDFRPEQIGLSAATSPSVGAGSAKETFQTQFAEISLDIYLATSFGLEGAYRRLLPGQSNLHRTMQGEAAKAGVFIDFGFLRIFGQWSHSLYQFDGGGAPNFDDMRQGLGGGLCFFF